MEEEETIMCYLRPAPKKKEPEERETNEAIRRTAIQGGVRLPTLMTRMSTGFNSPGCAITIVFTKSVEPRRPDMSPPKLYLAKNKLVGGHILYWLGLTQRRRSSRNLFRL